MAETAMARVVRIAQASAAYGMAMEAELFADTGKRIISADAFRTVVETAYRRGAEMEAARA